MASQGCEGLSHVQPAALGKHTLGLFDDHPAGRRALALFSEHVAVVDHAFLPDTDRGHISERLAEPEIGQGQHIWPGAKEVERADG
jgi:hypothetical protein